MLPNSAYRWQHGRNAVLPYPQVTPRECWRLQAFEDFLFDRARAAGISDAQLYKQAGNAVTVNVVYEIGLQLAEIGGGA